MLPKASYMGSVGTRGYRHRSSDTLGFEAPAPHIVVVCPSCKTSFAVETAAVAALETPRFHCSRCDDIFVMKDAPSDMLPLGGVHVQSLTQSGSQARLSNARTRAPQPESLIQASDFSIAGERTISHSFIEPNPVAPPEPTPTKRSELSLLNKSIEEPTAETGSEEQFETPFEEPFHNSNLQLSTGISASTPTAPASTTSARQFVLADPPPVLGEEPQTTKKSPPPVAKSEPIRNAQPLRSPLPQQTELYRPVAQGPRTDDSSVDQSSSRRRFSRRTQSLISLSTPILGALALLLGVSYVARLSPQSVDALANVSTPSFIQESAQALPPSALNVRNLRISFEKTRNKDLVPVVRGTVLNDSSRAFDDVELEVIGFNAHGGIVASSRAPLRSSLNNEKVTNLTLDGVRRAQTVLGTEGSSIAGQEAVPFSIALIDGRHLDGDNGQAEFDPAEVRYFSARIFSIKKSN